MATATVLALFSEADGVVLSLKEVVQDLFKTTELSPNTPPPRFEVKPVFTQVEGLDKLDYRTKIFVAQINHLLSKDLKGVKEFNDLQVIFRRDAALFAKSKPDADVPNHAIIAEKDEKYFEIDAGSEPPVEVVNKVEKWIKTEFMPNTEVRSLTGLDDRQTITNLLRFTTTQVTALSRLIVNSVQEERTVLNLGVIEYPNTESQYFRLYKIELKAWVKQFSVAGGAAVNKREWGLRGEFNAYGFEPTAEDNYNGIPETIREKMIKRFDAFANDLAIKVKKPAIKPPGCDGCAETRAACKAHIAVAFDEINDATF